MNDENNGSFISALIPFKLKMGIILGILLFLLVIIVPVLLVTVILPSADDDSESESSSSSSSDSGTSGSEVISGVTPNEAGFIFPVMGLNINNINVRKFPSYYTKDKNGNLKPHTGVDINIGVVGKKVLAVADGTVVYSSAIRGSDGRYASYGECVIIHHPSINLFTVYGHMLENSRVVAQGQQVYQGQVLGIVGSTGNSSGPHLHFEVRTKNSSSNAINPLPYLE